MLSRKVLLREILPIVRANWGVAPFSSAAADRMSTFGGNVFTEFTALANKHNAVNLGQGFPDWETPDFVRESAIEAISSGFLSNQYTSYMGFPHLVDTLASMYSDLLKRKIEKPGEVVVTNGATEALFAIVQSLVNPGDEVICIEPFYDTYPADVIMAGGKPVFVPLRPPKHSVSSQDWCIDFEELENAITERTKLIFLNTPHNPTGKVFSKEELEEISKIVLKHENLYVLSDEVYEYIVFDGLEHVRIGTIPNMFDRTLTVSSAGKTFSCTGWKIGWAIGPKELIKPVQLAHQWIPFCTTTPLQHAISLTFRKAFENNYFDELRQQYQEKRDLLIGAMNSASLEPVVPASGFFALGNTKWYRNLFEQREGELRDYEFSRFLTEHCGVTPIPPSAFYCDAHKTLAEDFTRFAFCKTNGVIEEGNDRLLRFARTHEADIVKR